MKQAAAENPSVCPNCGTSTTGNFCSQCGQATHLHEETFLGMIGHFIGHYFHYDSKFWQTLKALWFKPGKLSGDYWEGRRARHIPPISLYIFLSVVFFLCYFSLHKGKDRNNDSLKVTSREILKSTREKLDAMDSLSLAEAPFAKDKEASQLVDSESIASREILKSIRGKLDSYDTSASEADSTSVEGSSVDDSAAIAAQDQELTSVFGAKGKNLKTEKGKEAVMESFKHNFPKIFFFMIPVMAGMLRVLFIRRKHCYFVSHAVFSLHIHAFFFSVLLLLVLNPFSAIQGVLSLVFSLIAGIYFVLAIRNAYKVSIGRAILNVSVIAFLYFIPKFAVGSSCKT